MSTDDNEGGNEDIMSQPEEPELQWVEDTILQIGNAGFSLVSVCVTLCLNLAAAIWRALAKPE